MMNRSEILKCSLVACLLAGRGMAFPGDASALLPFLAGGVDPIMALEPTAWWRGDGNSLDTMGLYNGGSWVGTEDYGSGISGQAFNFDSSSIELGTMGDFGSTVLDGDVSVSFWFRINHSNIISVWGNVGSTEDNNNPTFRISLNASSPWSESPGSIGADLAPGGRGVRGYTGDIGINSNEWHHAALIFSTADMTLDFWVDGEKQITTYSLQNSVLVEPNDFEHPMYIGAENFRGSLLRNFIGLLDEMIVFDRALTEDEVEVLSNPANY